MNVNEKEYLSLRHLALKYDVHPDTIRKKAMVEGIHYIKIGKMTRYHIKNMHMLLTNETVTVDFSLEKFLID